ncbi:UNVERIFIED_CONTAM: hypothetical protein FKN15_052067 [Acipenser sinensis]
MCQCTTGHFISIPGPKVDTAGFTPLQYFQVFLTDDLVEHMVIMTNRTKAQNICDEHTTLGGTERQTRTVRDRQPQAVQNRAGAVPRQATAGADPREAMAGADPLVVEAGAADSLPLAVKTGAAFNLLAVEAEAAGSLPLSMETGAAHPRSLETGAALPQEPVDARPPPSWALDALDSLLLGAE